MLGTFSFELWFKSYRCFTVGSLELLVIAKRTFSSTSPPCSASRRRPPTAPPADAFPAFPAITSPCAGFHASPASSSHFLLPRAGASTPRHAAPPLPEPPRRPPPRRRRGKPKPEAQLSIFRAPEHYKKPRALFPSSFCQFPNPTPQNAAAAHPERRRASPRRGAATPGPLHPNSPHL